MKRWVDPKTRSLRRKFYLVGSIMILGGIYFGLVMPLYPFHNLTTASVSALLSWESGVSLYVAILGAMFFSLAKTIEE